MPDVRNAGRDAGERPRRPRRPAPELPDDVTSAELDREVRAELAGLGQQRAGQVGRHLVMAGRLLQDDPELAWQHARAARDLAGRIGVVREGAGLAAYRAGHYAEALAELRTARRMTGSQAHLPVMADCERGLGRPERALALAASPESGRLEPAGRIEMLIVAAGARIDLGQVEAAVLQLQVAQLEGPAGDATARLRAAYAEALRAAGRDDEAQHWWQRALDADVAGTAGLEPGPEDGDGAEDGSDDLVEMIDLLQDETGGPGR